LLDDAWFALLLQGYAPVVVDDPYTSDPADYWLHPCECAPPAWGMEKPVNPESFESVPGKSGNQFTPAPFELVAGQFVCPAKELLDNGVHFETETEQMERADCEARCKADNLCNFFGMDPSRRGSTWANKFMLVLVKSSESVQMRPDMSRLIVKMGWQLSDCFRNQLNTKVSDARARTPAASTPRVLIWSENWDWKVSGERPMDPACNLTVLTQFQNILGPSRVIPGQVAWQLFLAATVARWLTRSLAGLPA
jgi:hypothetical protein